MKITAKNLKEMVRVVISKQLNEEFGDSKRKEEAMPEDVVAYSTKVDALVKKTIEEARKLHAEGEEMMRSNVLSSYEVQERNRFLLYYVGFLSNLAANLVARLEDSHRQH